MPTTPIPSNAFEQAELASERVRIIGLLWSFAAIATVMLVRLVAAPGAVGNATAVSTFALLAAAATYEMLMLRFVQRRLADGRFVGPGIWRLNIGVETLVPTLAIVIVAGSGVMTPRQALVAPAILVYFFLIVLSTLRLSPGLSRLTGAAAGVGYLLSSALIVASYPSPPPGVDFDPQFYVTYAIFFLVGGFIAGGVAAEIRKHVAAALREVETRAQKEKLERDLDLARSVQQGLLPSAPPRSERYSVAGWNQPADQTGGDYFDWRRLPDGRIVVVLADVTGHGVGPALMAAACRAYGRATVPGGGDLGEAMTRMNDLLVEDLPPGKLITLVGALIDPGANQVQLLSAGHGPLLFYTATDTHVQQFDAHGIPFGVVPGMTYGPPQVLAMAPGDLIVLMTDGFFEWTNPAGEEFGMDRLETAIRSTAHLAPGEIIDRMHKAVTAFAGGTPQADDLTAVIIKRTS